MTHVTHISDKQKGRWNPINVNKFRECQTVMRLLQQNIYCLVCIILYCVNDSVQWTRNKGRKTSHQTITSPYTVSFHQIKSVWRQHRSSRRRKTASLSWIRPTNTDQKFETSIQYAVILRHCMSLIGTRGTEAPIASIGVMNASLNAAGKWPSVQSVVRLLLAFSSVNDGN